MENQIKKIDRVEDLPLWPQIQSGEYAAEWIKVGLTEGPRCTTEDFKKLCALLEVPCDVVCWVDNPILGGKLCRIRLGGVSLEEWHEKDVDPAWIEANMGKAKQLSVLSAGYARYGQHDAAWLGNLLAYDGLGIDLSPAKTYEPIVRGASWWYHAEDTIIASPRVTPKLDAQGNLHCADGPAIWGLYALSGQVLPEEFEWIVADPSRRTRKEFDSISNAEIRRVAIAAYPEAYIQGPPVHVDEYGELFDLESEGYKVVKVKDAYTERYYYLRVPPHVKTAHEGVASTFHMKPEDYHPDIQT